MKKLNYLLKYSFLIFNLLFLTSCGEEESETGDSNPDASIKMTAVSPTSQNLHFGEEANIQVLLTKTEVGGLAGEKIDFQLVGNSGGSALIDPRNKASKAAIKTDLDGFATLALKAGKQETQFNLRVKHTSGANKIFIIKIGKPRVELFPVGQTNRVAYKNERLTIQVKAIDERQRPYPSLAVKFEILEINEAKAASANLQVLDQITKGDGSAKAWFFTGNKATVYTIKVQSDQQHLVKFNIRIEPRNAGSCRVASDCSAGLICKGSKCIEPETGFGCNQAGVSCPSGEVCDPQSGTCKSTAKTCIFDNECKRGEVCSRNQCKVFKDRGNGHPCGQDNDCNEGLICKNVGGGSNGECGPGLTGVGGGGSGSTGGSGTGSTGGNTGGNSGGNTGGSNTCSSGKASPECQKDSQCQSGSFCNMGCCMQKPKPGQKVIDVSGKWFTNHIFDLSSALFGFPKLGGALDIVNQVFQNGLAGRLNKIPIIGGIIAKTIKSYVDKYVPAWAQKLIKALNGLANFLQTMRVEGIMNIKQAPKNPLFTGSEKWTHVYAQWIDQCPYGRSDPNFPKCAEIDIALGTHQIQMREVRPFNGNVAGNIMNIGSREVKMEIYKIVTFLVEFILVAISGEKDMEKAIQKLIDCSAVQTAIEGIARNIGYNGSMNWVKTICEGAKKTAAKNARNLLNGVGIKWTQFKFNGNASIIDNGASPIPRGIELINGKWRGKIDILIKGPLRGTWSGKR